MGDVIQYFFSVNGGAGFLTVADYMALCLGHPEHGYYMKADPFGANGDFTTAPEISQMFGEMIGVWVADTWHKTGLPDPFILLECGPGRGTLMADLRRATKNIPGFSDAAQVHFLEISPVLRAVQKERHPDAIWHETLETVPRDIPIIVIANEFFDALPVHQLVKISEVWHERVIESEEGRLRWGINPAPEGLQAMIPESLKNRQHGAIVEMSPQRIAVMRELCTRIETQGGAALIIDYGYDVPDMGDTLQAVYRHAPIDVLEKPGDSDLTAHVDFSALVNAVKELKVFGPVGQGAFLKSLGIETRARSLVKNANATQISDIESALHRLTDAAQMGTLFKVMGISRDAELAGF